ncbi:hypothetical protein GL325_09375 [Aeromicrobium sp. 636]|uniref:DoxX family membrane protein n=1 Tax=Aeromicrobium senzhongii TaxID=2663859 RepID=A0A8I0EU86_9ACTN|nr:MULTISPECIES: hypothetical protein [Aeromicrobium]MBC9226531.1 hypothetical protein [Aeromicrobium senzhongii]MCQ3998634.1 hypothetical protein [Aeromicrobium sp. 636]
MKLSHVPLRLATGAFILNSGLSKRNLPPEAAEGLQDMAANGVPQVKSMDPQTFGKALSAGEIALGAALLTPFVPATMAGAALTAFGGGLVKMYLNTPGMTAEGSSFRPSQDGTALAKDIWLVGAGLSLLISGLTSRKSIKI